MSEMAIIGRHGLTELDWGLLREMRDGPGGSASRTIGDQGATDPAGELLVRGDTGRLGSCRWGGGSDLTGLRMNRLFRHWGATPQRIVDGINKSCWTALKGCWEVGTQWCQYLRLGWRFSAGGPQVSGARRHRRGMRLAGGSRPFPQRKINGLTDEREVRPLSVEVEEFSLGTGSRNRVTAGTGSYGGGDFLPSRTGPGSIVIRCDAAVLTVAEAGAAALADIAGAVAPVDLAGTIIPAVAGMKLSAVVEVHSSVVDDEGDPSVIRTSRQRSAVILDPMAASRKDGGPMEEISVLEPLEHSVLEVSLEGGDSSIVEVAMSDPLEHSGVDRAADVVSGLLLPEPLEHSGLVVPLEVVDGSVADITVLDPLEHSGVGVQAETVSAYVPRVYSEDPRNVGGGLRDHQGADNTLPDPLKEVERAQPEDGEAIVVGAIGSAAPWFLTGWANDMEVEFMIDTGCQVTILSMSVFK